MYRMNVEEDKSAIVKVYDSTVYVASPPRDASKPLEKATQPQEVACPHAVSPPYHEVLIEAWAAIVKAMQQNKISPDGNPSRGFRFQVRCRRLDEVEPGERQADAVFAFGF
jgi:hypothetical protein